MCIRDRVSKDEASFLKDVEKIKADLEKSIEAASKKTSPDREVVQFKKDELDASLLGLMNQYEMNHAPVSYTHLDVYKRQI